MTRSNAMRSFVIPASLSGNVANDALGPDQSGNVATPAPSNVAIHPSFVPRNEAELQRCLEDVNWRICSGQLYKIMVKSDSNGGDSVVSFVPNRAQRRLMARMWHRNIILKARQLGFTTLIAILWLDHALFNANQRCVVVAQDKDKAEEIFRDKVRFAYDNLPPSLLETMPLKVAKASELLFAHNNSAIKVSTSARGGTPHRLHISEYGKICAQYPLKAKEIVTGSLPAVPLDGIVVIESTAEGQEGDFHDKTQRAIEQAQQGVVLTPKDFRMHFFPWWGEPGYRIQTPVPITDKERDYFTTVEAATGCSLDQRQRWWYISTRDSDFSGDPELMWQEFPSTAAEAFQVSTEGTYYALQLAAVRKSGRILNLPYIEGIPVNTFWDIGNSDGTAIWFHQRVGAENRFINFFEGWGESYAFYIEFMQKQGYVWGTHYLPHDAAHKRQQAHKVASPEDELREFKLGGAWTIVPPVDQVINGIQKMRGVFGTCLFDTEKTAPGMVHLTNYRKTWNKAKGAWQINAPRKVDGDSEAADAIRQFAQGYMAPALVKGAKRARTNWRTA